MAQYYVEDRRGGRNVQTPMDVEDVSRRIDDILQIDNQNGGQAARLLARQIMNGAKETVEAVLGSLAPDLQYLPAANYIFTHNERLAQKINALPDLKVHPPQRGRKTDLSDAARDKAEKRARIVNAYDQAAALDQQMPYIARWLVGYQYVPMVIVHGRTPDGYVFPKAELRDSFGSIVPEWGLVGQPPDFMSKRRTSKRNLERLFPHVRGKLDADRERYRGGVMLNHTPMTNRPRFENDAADGVDWYEYWDVHGRWLVVADRNLLLDFIPNPVESGPQFHVFRAPTFDKLSGAQAHSIGLLSTIARQELLREKAMVEAVNSTELNITGEVVSNAGLYIRGAGKTNVLTPGTKVERVRWDVPYQIFEHTSRLVDQLRTQLNYPVADDGRSPMSNVTGKGLEELATPSGREVDELQRVIAYGVQCLDALRLEFDQRTSNGVKKPLVGAMKGSLYAEEYTPEKDIAGNYGTERDFGIFATLEEPQKLAAMSAMQANEWIDPEWAQDNIGRIGNVSDMRDRIRAKAARDFLFQSVATGQVPPPNIVEFFLGYMADSDEQDRIREQLIPEEQPQQAPPMPVGPAPDYETMLQQAMAAESSTMSQVGPGGGSVSQRVIA